MPRIGMLRWLLLSAAVLAVPALAQELPLGRGDTVRMAVAGLPELDIEATVDAGGWLDLLWVGRMQADGRELEDLEQELRQRPEGLLVKQYGMDGRLFIIQLEPDEVNLVRTAQAPVTVGGSVQTPGEVPFTAGMTVREALALAGGADAGMMDAGRPVDATVLLRWQADYAAAATTHADALARLWRIQAALSDGDEPSPPESEARVSPEAFTEMIAAQRALLDAQRSQQAGERAFLAEARAQAEGRLLILGRQRETLAETLAADEEEETRINDLVSRGLAPSSRASDARRSTVLSATRLLELEEVEARAALDLTRLDRDADALDETRDEALLVERAEAERTRRVARQAMEVTAGYLAMAGSEVALTDMGVTFDTQVTLYRRTAEGRQPQAADPDTPLRPGDTLDVTLGEADTRAEGPATDTNDLPMSQGSALFAPPPG